MSEPENEKSLEKAKENALELLDNNVGKEYAFHSTYHTVQVVQAVEEICQGFELSEKDVELIKLSAWFHDTGYTDGNINHEERSCKNATSFMRENGYTQEEIDIVCRCIMSTKMDASPDGLKEQIINDADLSHLGKPTYWDLSGKLRMEYNLTKDKVMSEQEWVEIELDFLENHRYHTIVARELYDKRKRKHISQLHKRKLRLNPEQKVNAPEKNKDKKKHEKKKKKKKKGSASVEGLELKEIRLGRGVETMYRATYRTHINLSSIADNKANIMLSINAIIISISLSTLIPRVDAEPKLIIPTGVLLLTCLVSIVYATLSTRPKVTKGTFTREDIDLRRANLMFFGNFFNMPIEEFHYGMMEMIKDQDFLYSSMTRDLYYLGVVLAKKYRFLSMTYFVFMYGLIASVLAFAAAYIFF